MLTLALMAAATFGASAVGTGLLRAYALSRRLLDVPNERSSHSATTPRGGGVAAAATFLAVTAALVAGGYVAVSLGVALIGAGTMVGAIGFADDHRDVAPGWRLLVHFAAAAWALAWTGGLPRVSMPGGQLTIGWLGYPVAALGLVWLLNLYNFMDGIDGIAGVEALTVSTCAVVLARLVGGPQEEWILPAMLGFASAGFLAWNFPPARIFLGDAGSGFLGITLGILALRSAAIRPDMLWSWLILLGVFIVDATVTLVQRRRRGQSVHLAHRTHAYQHAALRAGAHRPVTLGTAVINVCWLLPVAALVATDRIDGVLGLGIAYAPLIVLALRLGAGQAEGGKRTPRVLMEAPHARGDS